MLNLLFLTAVCHIYSWKGGTIDFCYINLSGSVEGPYGYTSRTDGGLASRRDIATRFCSADFNGHATAHDASYIYNGLSLYRRCYSF